MLSARIHVKDQTIPIRANSQHGLVISHALPTQALPGITQDKTLILNSQELIEALDELIEQIDRYHEAVRVLIEELKQDE
jgi:recombinational DNA repair protein (RecF pathway)